MNNRIRLFTILGFLSCIFFTGYARAQSPQIIWQLPYTVNKEFYSVKFSRDNTQLIAGGSISFGGSPDILIKRFAAANGTEIASTPSSYFGRSRELAVSPDETKIVAANDSIRCDANVPAICDGGYKQFDGIQLNQLAIPPDGNMQNFTADYSPDGQYIALGGSYYNFGETDYFNLRLIRASDLRIVRTMEGHSRGANNGGTLRARFSPDGTLIASSGFDSFVKIWRVSDGALLRSINFDNAYQVDSVAFSPDGQYVAAGRYGTDAQVKVWRVSTGELVKTFDVSSTFANTLFNKVAWTPDGRYIAAGISFSPGYGDNKIRFWNFESGQLAQDYSTQADRFIFDLTFSKDGQRFAWSASSQVFVAVNPFPGAASNVSKTFCDFDGDRKADVSVFRDGAWYMQESTGGFRATQFGTATDKIVPADYDGDGKTDVAVYRGGTWYLQRSQLGFAAYNFGAADDIPVPADYDGDGKSDIAVFRPSNGSWYLLQSSNGFAGVAFGQAGDVPVGGDYDGDGRTDVSVFRPSNSYWYRLNSSNGSFNAVSFGQSGDIPVRGDFDGDGKSDTAVFRPSNGSWYLQRSRQGFAGVQFGQSGDIPVSSDYDGDGQTDIAVFRPSSGAWHLQRSTGGFNGIAFGVSTDIPIPALR